MADTRYLKKRGHSWYVSVNVPPKLRVAVGSDRFIKALGTRDIHEANRRKHHWVAEFKRRIEDLRRSGHDPYRKHHKLALELRDAMAIPGGDTDELRSVILDYARDLSETNMQAALRFRDTALGRATHLDSLWPQWLEEAETTQRTKDACSVVVRDYLTWAGQSATVEETDKQKVGEYTTHLLKLGRARTTVRRYIGTLSGFWTWLESKGLANVNPWRSTKFKVRHAGRSRALTDDKLVRLLSAEGPVEIQGLMRLALLTGWRVSELCEGVLAAVKRDDGYWLVIEKSKTGPGRAVPLHKLGEPWLKKLRGLTLDAHLLPPAYVRFRRAAGVGERGDDFHAFRNTFISMMEGLGVPESTVKLLVGHKRSSMTYGHYSDGKLVNLREVINRLRYGDDVMRLLASLPQ